MFEDLSPNMLKVVKDWIKNNYQQSKENNREMLVVFDKNGNDVFHRTGNNVKVDITTKDEIDIKNAKGEITIHTHVDSKGQNLDFSEKDVLFFMSCGFSQMYAIDDTYIYEIAIGKQPEYLLSKKWISELRNTYERKVSESFKKELKKKCNTINLKNPPKHIISQCITETLDEVLSNHGFKHNKEIRGDL